jgi:hypothetical protein
MKRLSILTAALCSLFQIAQAQYCIPAITCDANITSVFIIDGASGGTALNNTSGCENYGDFTNLPVFDLTVGVANLAEIVSNNTTTGVNNTNVRGFVLWIDEDQSGTFENTEAHFMAATPLVAAEITFTIPATALSGITRMRIRWDISTPAQGPWDNAFACGAGRGEVEDYLVNIINPTDLTPGCATAPMPADAATDVCNTGTVLSFTAPAAGATPAHDPTGYNFSLWTNNGTIAYLEEDTDLGTATSFTITDVLTPGETYYWQVKPYNDAATNEGCAVWSFTTAAEPNPSPVIAVDGDNSRLVEVCAEADASFTLTDENSTSYAGATYDWNGTDNTSYPLSDTTIADPVFNSVDFGTTYELALLVTDQYGCTGVDTVDVFVKERATPGSIQAPSGTKVCEGDVAVLNLTGYNGDITWKYSLTSATTNLVNTGDFDDEHTTSPVLQSTYYVAIVDLNGCTDTTSVFIEKKDLPFQPAILNGGLTFCDGDSAYLQASWPGPGSLTWDDAAMSTTEVIWLTETGTYTVTGTSSVTGCSNTSDPVTVTKNDNPNNPLVIETGGIPCEGDTTSIQVAISGADSLFWINDNSGYNTDLDLMISESVSYTFVNKNNTGCYSDTVAYDVVFGTPPNKPTVNMLSNDSLQVIGNAATYYWYTADGTLVSTETDSIFTPSQNGTYYVIGGNGPCLGEPSDTTVVDLFIGLNDYSFSKEMFKVYPNPTNSDITVDVSTKNSILQIVDITGKTVYTETLSQGKNNIQLDLENGVYMVIINNNFETQVEKLIVE